MEKILVAGATGYLGQYLVKELKKRNYWVRVLIRKESQKGLFAEVDDFYIGEITSEITPGSTGVAGGQISIVKDSEVSSVSGKNLVVVGGSCINTVAAKILGSTTPICTADFTTKTGVGAGQYIIKTVESPYNSDKVAMLVAGYAAADTVNAVDKALEGATSDSGTEQVYPIVSA